MFVVEGTELATIDGGDERAGAAPIGDAASPVSATDDADGTALDVVVRTVVDVVGAAGVESLEHAAASATTAARTATRRMPTR